MAQSEEVKLNSTRNFSDIKESSKRTSFWSYFTSVAKWSEIIKPQSKSSKENTSVNYDKKNTIRPKDKKSESEESKSVHFEMDPKPEKEINEYSVGKFPINLGNKNSVHLISHKLQMKNSQLLGTGKRKTYKSSTEESNQCNGSSEKQSSDSSRKTRNNEKRSSNSLRKTNRSNHGKVNKLNKYVEGANDEKSKISAILSQKIKTLETQISELQYINPAKQDSLTGCGTNNKLGQVCSFNKLKVMKPELHRATVMEAMDISPELHQKTEKVKKRKSKRQSVVNEFSFQTKNNFLQAEDIFNHNNENEQESETGKCVTNLKQRKRKIHNEFKKSKASEDEFQYDMLNSNSITLNINQYLSSGINTAEQRTVLLLLNRIKYLEKQLEMQAKLKGTNRFEKQIVTMDDYYLYSNNIVEKDNCSSPINTDFNKNNYKQENENISCNPRYPISIIEDTQISISNKKLNDEGLLKTDNSENENRNKSKKQKLKVNSKISDKTEKIEQSTDEFVSEVSNTETANSELNNDYNIKKYEPKYISYELPSRDINECPLCVNQMDSSSVEEKPSKTHQRIKSEPSFSNIVFTIENNNSNLEEIERQKEYDEEEKITKKLDTVDYFVENCKEAKEEVEEECSEENCTQHEKIINNISGSTENNKRSMYSSILGGKDYITAEERRARDYMIKKNILRDSKMRHSYSFNSNNIGYYKYPYKTNNSDITDKNRNWIPMMTVTPSTVIDNNMAYKTSSLLYLNGTNAPNYSSNVQYNYSTFPLPNQYSIASNQNRNYNNTNSSVDNIINNFDNKFNPKKNNNINSNKYDHTYITSCSKSYIYGNCTNNYDNSILDNNNNYYNNSTHSNNNNNGNNNKCSNSDSKPIEQQMINPVTTKEKLHDSLRKCSSNYSSVKKEKPNPILKLKMKCKSLTDINSVTNNFLKELRIEMTKSEENSNNNNNNNNNKKNNIVINNKEVTLRKLLSNGILVVNDDGNRINNYSNNGDNNNSCNEEKKFEKGDTDVNLLTNIIKLSPIKTAIDNKYSIYIVLVNDDSKKGNKEKRHTAVNKAIDETRVKQMIIDLKNSINSFICNEKEKNTEKNKNEISNTSNNNEKNKSNYNVKISEKNKKLGGNKSKSHEINNEKRKNISNKEIFNECQSSYSITNYGNLDKESIKKVTEPVYELMNKLVTVTNIELKEKLKHNPKYNEMFDINEKIENIENLEVNEKTENLEINEKTENLEVNEKTENLEVNEKTENLEVNEKTENLEVNEKIKNAENTENLEVNKIENNVPINAENCQCTITGTNVCFPPINLIEYNISDSNFTDVACKEKQTKLKITNKQSPEVKNYSQVIDKLKKDLEVQKKEVRELKTIWLRCSSRLDDIWQSSSTQTNPLSIYPPKNYNMFYSRIENDDQHCYLMKNDINLDGNISKPNIIQAFQTIAESSLILSNIFSDVKSNCTSKSQQNYMYEQKLDPVLQSTLKSETNNKMEINMLNDKYQSEVPSSASSCIDYDYDDEYETNSEFTNGRKSFAISTCTDCTSKSKI